jgi:hypothetical protein
MHSIKNISERNKIETQSRADAYIRRKRLKTLSSGQIYKKNKKTQKTQKTQKPQKTTGLVFFKPGFFQPCVKEFSTLPQPVGPTMSAGPWDAPSSPLLHSHSLSLQHSPDTGRHLAVVRIKQSSGSGINIPDPGFKFFSIPEPNFSITDP